MSPVDGLRCHVGSLHGWTVLALAGELDFSESHKARRALLSLQILRHGRLALDLRDLTFMDTSGVRLILEAMHRAEDRGAEFALVRGPAPVHDVLELVGLAEQLRVVADPGALAAGARAVAPPPPLPGGILRAIGHTPLVPLARLSPDPRVRLWAKLESHNPTGSVKDRVAAALIEDAEQRGALRPGQAIVEAASANAGVSLAMVCAHKGYRLKTVIPDDVTPEQAQLLAMYGAEVAHGVADSSCLRHDDAARAHYEGTGPEILAALGEIAAFVAGLGTGATLTGTGRRLREALGDGVQLVAAQPPHGAVPPLADLALLDRRSIVTDREAVAWTRRLLDEEGIFAGPSAGAAAAVAVQVARELDEGDVVFVVGDAGWRYLSAGLHTRPVDEVEPTAWW